MWTRSPRKRSWFVITTLLSIILTFAWSVSPGESLSTPNNMVYDCCVIGAGPAGLATAYGLRKVLGPDAKIAVWERTKKFRTVGGQVGLLMVALNALAALDPSVASAVREKAVPRALLRRVHANGTLEDEMKFDLENPTSVVIPWFDLQQALLAECQEMTGGVEVTLGHELEQLQESKDMVDLTFSNGHTCKARCVIGADGNLSRVRQILFPEETIPAYSGSCIWRMFVNCPWDETEIPDQVGPMGESTVWTGNGKVLAMQRMQDRIYLSGQAGWPEDQLDALDRKRYIGIEDGVDSGGTTKNVDRLKRFLNSFEEFDPQVRTFIQNHCEQTSILEHPIYFRRTGRPWGKGRVSMVGDSAHVMPPNMACGTPSAFEDAVQLAHSVSQWGLSPQAFRHYERTRQPRVNRIADAAIQQAGLYFTEKDDKANPFQMNQPELMAYVMEFSQDPVPAPR